MKLKVKRKELMKCLDVLAVSIPKKTTVQIMSNFLFVVEDNMCNIYAYNGELQIQGQVAVESSENFKLCIPANRLMNTARLMTDEDLTLKYDDEKFVLNLVAGKKRYKLTGENPVHFPVQTLAEEGNMRLKVPSNQIIKHIKTLSTIVDWTEMRPMMAGVTMFVNHGKIEITGVHNAAYFYRGVTDIAHDEHFEVVLHKDIAMALGNAKEIGDTDILISERSIRVKVDGFTFTSVLINVKSILLIEKYFDYERDKYLVVDKNEILGSIRRLLNYANEFSTLVMDVSKGEMNLSCENVAFSVDGEEILEVVNQDFSDRRFGFNMKYLMSIFGNIEGDQVKIFAGTGNVRMACIQDYNIVSDSDMWGIGEVDLKAKTK